MESIIRSVVLKHCRKSGMSRCWIVRKESDHDVWESGENAKNDLSGGESSGKTHGIGSQMMNTRHCSDDTEIINGNSAALSENAG